MYSYNKTVTAVQHKWRSKPTTLRLVVRHSAHLMTAAQI